MAAILKVPLRRRIQFDRLETSTANNPGITATRTLRPMRQRMRAALVAYMIECEDFPGQCLRNDRAVIMDIERTRYDPFCDFRRRPIQR
jgi:hypothetical protein